MLLDIDSVAMIHPYWDMALLKVQGLPDQHPVLKLSLDDPDDLVDRDIVCVGYPAFDPRNDAQVQNKVFGGVYYVKRLQPGKVRAGVRRRASARRSTSAPTTAPPSAAIPARRSSTRRPDTSWHCTSPGSISRRTTRCRCAISRRTSGSSICGLTFAAKAESAQRRVGRVVAQGHDRNGWDSRRFVAADRPARITEGD